MAINQTGSKTGKQTKLSGATTSPISKKYAKRVVAAMISSGRFSYGIADQVADEHITEIDVWKDPMQDGDYGISATVEDVDEVKNSRTLELFGFELAETRGVRLQENGNVVYEFGGFRKPENDSYTVSMEDGLLKSDSAIKCHVEIVLTT